MTTEAHEDMTLKHNQILMGVNDKNGIVDKVDEHHEWYLTSRGKNSVIMFIKDLLITSGIIVFFLTLLVK